MTQEDIGENDTALLCMTNLTACCQAPSTGENGSALGSWFFPNGTRVCCCGNEWIYRDRGQMVVGLNRRSVGVEGIYRCEIPDSTNVPQTMYIGVYRASTSTGEYTVHFYSIVVILLCCSVLCCRRYSVIDYAAYEMPCISELTYVHPKM